MKSKIEKAIEELTKRAEASTDSNDAMKFSQAALNMAHCLGTVVLADKEK